METKRELLSKLLDTQLTLVVSLHRAIATHNITEESPLSGELLNAILGVEALTNAIAALPLTTEEKAQKRDRGWARISAVDWQTSEDKLKSNGDDEPMFIPDDDAGW